MIATLYNKMQSNAIKTQTKYEQNLNISKFIQGDFIVKLLQGFLQCLRCANVVKKNKHTFIKIKGKTEMLFHISGVVIVQAFPWENLVLCWIALYCTCVHSLQTSSVY